MSDAERCVCCGEIIPEGNQVCSKCANKVKPGEDIYMGKMYTKDGEPMSYFGDLKDVITWAEENRAKSVVNVLTEIRRITKRKKG